MQLSQQHINIIQTVLADKPVHRAYLFGSRVRNEATSESDIYLLVDLNYNFGISLLGFVGMKQELENQLKITVDLVSSQGISPFIKPFIDVEKQLIYEK
jgi:predicted nucleotidyltransferase